MGENERQRTFLAPQPPSAPKHSNPSVRRPSVSDGGVTSKQSENQDRPSQPARGILKQFAVTFGDGFAEDMDENPFASFAAPPADDRGPSPGRLPSKLNAADEVSLSVGVATTAMQDIHIAKPPASTIGTIAEEGPMPSFHFGSDLAVSRQDARPQSSRVSTDPRPEEGSLVSKAFTAGAQRTAGSSTGFLNRLLSAGPAGNTPAVVTIKPAVRPPTLTEEDRGPTSGPLSDNGIFSATVDLDFRRKSGSLSRDGLACPPSPRPSGGGILDQMDRPSRPSTPLSPLRSPLPSPGGTASGFLRLQTSNPGTLTALRESFLAGSHRDMTLAEPQGHDAGGRLRQFGAKHGSGSEASTPLPSAMFQRMPAPWLKNIPPPSPIELTGRSFSLPRPETAQPSQPGAEYKSHSLQRRDSPEQPTPPPVPGASSNALRPTPPPPLLSPGSSGPKRRISTSAGTPTASLTAAPPPPPDMMEISPAQLHSSLPPARPSLIPDLPESVKADIFGSGGAPDKIHSTAIPGFTVGRVIGEGGFCQVRVGAHHLSAQKVAVKVVDKGKIEDADEEKMIRREIRTMKHLNGHSRIIRLYMTLENDQFIYIVMELATGGTLLDYIKKQKSLQKSEAARLLAQLVSGLDYCHKRGVVHRDIKLENVMTDDKNNLKIIDLGLCAFYQPGKKLRVYCGSPSYAAPEIISCTEYDGPPVDVWSLGVCFYAMLAGYLPFYNSTGKKDIDDKIMAARYKMPEFMKNSSVKTLIEGILVVDPVKRMTLDKVLAHPWMKSYCPKNAADEVPMDLDNQALLTLTSSGFDKKQILRSLMDEEVSEVTAAYHLLALRNSLSLK